MPWDPKKCLKASIKLGGKLSVRRLRKEVKRLIRLDKWDEIPKKVPIILDDGS